jgi:hypothetical protein
MNCETTHRADQVALLDRSAVVDAQTPSAIYNAMVNQRAGQLSRHRHHTTYIWNSLCCDAFVQVHPLAPFSLAGFTWYQGESNVVKCDTKIYTDKTLALVNGWREVFQQPELPFYFVQLAPFIYTEAFGPSWEEQGFENRAVRVQNIQFPAL